MLRDFRWLWLLLLLAACTPTDQPPTESGPRIPPTLTPQAYYAPQERLTLGNITRISVVGRLDQPSAEPQTIFNYALSSDGTRFVGLNDQQIIAWDLFSGAVVFNTDRGGGTIVYYASDKTEIYTLDESTAMLRIHDENGIFQNNIITHSAPPIQHTFYNEDGWLALGGQNGEVRVWDTYERTALGTFLAHNGPIATLAFSPDGTQLATSGITDGQATINIYDWRARTLSHQIAIGDRPAMRLAWSPTGTQVAIGSFNDVRLWNYQTADAPLLLSSGEDGARVMQYSPDGQRLLTGGRTTDMLVWNSTDGSLFTRLPNLGGDSISADFSADSTVIVTARFNRGVSLWNLNDIVDGVPRLAELTTPPTILFADWTDDGRTLLFVDSTGTVYLWGIAEANLSTPTALPIP
jgi:WD40 repeat protein